MAGILAIVGRPNVGKSTLFNRLTESRKAIVDDESGVTRDRIYGSCEWNGKEFSVIDTGGYVQSPEDVFESEIKKQVELAIAEADVLVFMCDVTTGITGYDDAVAAVLRRSKKTVVLAVNKVDNTMRQNDVFEFFNLGLGDPFAISSTNGAGTGELLDKAISYLPENLMTEEAETEIPHFAIVGQPNVGKSSLINCLVGEERNLVTDIPGTTRDAINSNYNKFGFEFIITDTAGIRRKQKVHEDLEFYSVIRAVRAIEQSDVGILMLDATKGIEAQDMHIFRMIQKNSKGIVLVVNKWDLVEKGKDTVKEYMAYIKDRIAPFTDVPVIFVSVLEKQRIHKVLDMAMKVYKNRKQRIPTNTLNKYMLKAVESYKPPAVRGQYIKIKYVTQLPTHAPAFAFFCNFPQYLRDPYKRYLENKLRESFDLSGVPIRLFFRKK